MQYKNKELSLTQYATFEVFQLYWKMSYNTGLRETVTQYNKAAIIATKTYPTNCHDNVS